MHLTSHRALLLFVVVATVAAIVLLAMEVPTVRDALAVVIAVGLVVLFFGLRLVAWRLRLPDDREFDFWGGMGETMDELLARYRRPGANPILPPDGGRRVALLPDAAPKYGGHSVGEQDPAEARASGAR